MLISRISRLAAWIAGDDWPGSPASSPEGVCYPGSPHLWHSTANVGGNGGAQQKKSNDRSDNRWNLPHGYVSPLLGPRCSEKIYAEMLPESRKSAGPKPRARAAALADLNLIEVVVRKRRERLKLSLAVAWARQPPAVRPVY